MRSGHDWLPLETLVRPAVASRFSAVIEAWSGDWFQGRQIMAERLETFQAGRDWSGDWRARNPWLAIKSSDRGLSRLRNWALELELDQFPMTAADSKVMTDFQGRMLDDLAARLTRMINPPSSEAGDMTLIGEHGGLQFDIGEGLISVALPLAAVTPLVRSGLPSSPTARPPLTTRTRAAETESLNLEGLLGQARITLGELQSLAPGDVLVLDRNLSSHASVALADGSIIAQARLTERGDRRALILQ